MLNCDQTPNLSVYAVHKTKCEIYNCLVDVYCIHIPDISGLLYQRKVGRVPVKILALPGLAFKKRDASNRKQQTCLCGFGIVHANVAGNFFKVDLTMSSGHGWIEVN